MTCVWLQPFYPSPNRDNGYDVTDYYGVNTKHGSLGDFVQFMNHAKALGIRVIVDLVVNHTSVEHPWFQSARGNARWFFREWYVWADDRPKDHEKGIVFLGWGDLTVLRTDTPEVLALRYDFRGVSMLTLHNLVNRPKTVTVDPKVKGGQVLTDVFDENHSRSENSTHEIKMPPYGHRWLRVGAIDNALSRSAF